jgi:hypothetical protein
MNGFLDGLKQLRVFERRPIVQKYSRNIPVNELPFSKAK